MLRLANSTSLVRTWHGAPSQVNHCVPKDSPNQPPTIIYKTAAKDLIDQDPRTTHLEGNLGLKLSNKQSTQVKRWPPPNDVLAVALGHHQMKHSAMAKTQPLPKHHSAVAYAYPVLATTEMTLGHGRQNLYPVLNLFLPNMEVFLHLNVVPGVSIHI